MEMQVMLRKKDFARATGRTWRPCEVDGRPARFHSWAIQERALLRFKALLLPDVQEALAHKFETTGIVPPCCDVEKITNTFAIIERENGTVKLVPAEKVRFTDREEHDE